MLSLPEMGLGFSLVLFLIGFLGLMLRRNVIFMMLAIEIMLNAVNLAFISAGALTGTRDGQVAFFFVMAVAACEAGLGLALIIALFRSRASLDPDDLRLLRG